MISHDELEPKLTALLLGELPPDEAQALHAAIAQDLELEQLYRRLEQTLGLVREAATQDRETASLRLSSKRREKLLAHFKTVSPAAFAEPKRKRFPLVEIAAAVALMAILAAVLLPALSKSKSKAQHVFLSRGGRSPEVDDEKSEGREALVESSSERKSATLRRFKGDEALSTNPSAASSESAFRRRYGLGDSSAKGADSATAPSVRTEITLPPTDSLEPSLNIVLADGSVQQFNRAKLQEALRNSGDVGAPIRLKEQMDSNGKVGDGVTVIGGQAVVDPATGMPAVSDRSSNTPVPNQKAAEPMRAGSIVLPYDTAGKPESALPGLTLRQSFGGGGGGGAGGFNPNLSLQWKETDSKPSFYSDSYSQTHSASPTPEANIQLGANLYQQSNLANNWSFAGGRTSGAKEGKDAEKPPILGDLPTLGKTFPPATPPNLNLQDDLRKSLAESSVSYESLGVDSSHSFSNRFLGRYAYSVTNIADAGWNGILERPGYSPSAPAGLAPSSTVTIVPDLAYNNTTSPDQNTLYRNLTPLADKEVPTKSSGIVLPDTAGVAGGLEGATSLPQGKAKSDSSSSKLEALEAPAKSQQEKVIKAQRELDELREKLQASDAVATDTQSAYFAKNAEVDELPRSRQLLEMKLAAEQLDEKPLKASPIIITDLAKAEQSEKSTFGERFRGFLTGEVERKARIKIDQTDRNTTRSPVQDSSYDPYFLQTEFEVIRSDKVLSNVVEKLNLGEKWARKKGEKLSNEDAVRLLRKKIDLNAIRETGQFEVGVRDDSAEDAAQLANAVSKSYLDFHKEATQEASQRSMKALQDRLAAQEQKVAQAQTELAQLQKPPEKPQPIEDIARKTTVPPLIPQPEILTRENTFSTFSLNVSDVSFKLAAASLEKGVLPDTGSIRSEEFINAFDYRDPEPAPGVPVAFAWERARYPFAQNRDLLRFSIKTAATGRQPGRPLNLVLLLDNSGSMERADRIRIIQESFRVLATQLQPQDKLSVITFSRTARLWKDGIPGNQAAQVAEEVSGLTPQGGTNLEEAMTLAYRTALRHYLTNGLNRVVVLTDGAANLGNVDPKILKQKVEANRKQGIALDCFGIGWDGYNDDLLEVLSRNGDGRYGFINTPEEAATNFATQLAGALQVAASDVKVQVEFNPNRVNAYRQIGYAKHQLTKEQFRDNTVDAAEIAAAESGNALYVIETNPSGQGPLATIRVRYKLPGTTDYREHEWPVPYTGNAVALEQSTPAMRLASTAAAFSEWLASNPYATEVTPDRLLTLLRGIPEVYNADPRPKHLEWMLRQSQTLSGK